MAKIFLPKTMVMEKGGKTFYFRQHRFSCDNCVMRNQFSCGPVGKYCYKLYRIAYHAKVQPFSCTQVTNGVY